MTIFTKILILWILKIRNAFKIRACFAASSASSALAGFSGRSLSLRNWLSGNVFAASLASSSACCLLSASTSGVPSGVSWPAFWTALPAPGLSLVPDFVPCGFHYLPSLSERLSIFRSVALMMNWLESAFSKWGWLHFFKYSIRDTSGPLLVLHLF
jgi:hypothetical protein